MRNITRADIESRPLTAEEKGWLRQRDRHAEVDLNEALHGRPVIEGEDEIERELGVGPSSTPAEGGVDEGDDYDNWKKAELREEGESRTPPVDFTGCTSRAEMIAAMRAWDAAHPEE